MSSLHRPTRFPTRENARLPGSLARTDCQEEQLNTDQGFIAEGCGWQRNNGSTLTAGVIANRERIPWLMKDKVQQTNYFVSLTQASTCRIDFLMAKKFTPLSRTSFPW
ncbi:hypothetical protein SUGI_1144810 [Cryptomeria japonica]|nr:hypothetical protein SUGI_1144810 [Cryptomeria japonica]